MRSLALLVTLCALGFDARAGEESDGPEKRLYTYSWQFLEGDSMAPRGGTTKGPAVTLDESPNERWLAMQKPGLTKQERDRRAILAMVGGFRTSFDFIETVGFVDEYEPKQPYQSWGTEFVYVVEDRPDFVSLQHIIVMFFETEDGEIAGPAVVKHWRQDWHYEDRELHVYAGHRSWERRRLKRREFSGAWSQSVYQVDDSPRYQAIGRWRHEGSYSSWESENTWRPLPRRESSVRDDYHVLSGTNRHTITPTGWVHEEDNLKVVLDADGERIDRTPYIAREAGFNRYDRIVDHDFSAGDEYWSATGAFWTDVRTVWEEIFAERDRVALSKRVDDKLLFEILFGYAASIADAGSYESDEGIAFIRETMRRFLI
ncbi:MAG: DUF6607 family protein [Pseudomonadota bacterium]